MVEAAGDPGGPESQAGEQAGEQVVRAQRVAAYALVCVDDQVLLTQMSQRTPVPGQWGLPGGGIDHGESPYDAVVREVHEETAHDLVEVQLADVGSVRFTARAPSGRLEDFHTVQVLYRAGVAQIREPVVLDVDGSTAQSRWVPVADLADLALTPSTSRWLARLLDHPDLAVP